VTNLNHSLRGTRAYWSGEINKNKNEAVEKNTTAKFETSDESREKGDA